jgi:hypothetical protein
MVGRLRWLLDRSVLAAKCVVSSRWLCAGGISFLCIANSAGGQTSRACEADSEIGAHDRAAIDDSALQFIKGGLDSEKGQQIRSIGPFDDLHVAHRYVADSIGGAVEQWIDCGDSSATERWVTVRVKPGPRQSYVVAEARTINNTWAFVVWLSEVHGAWHAQDWGVAPASAVGRSPSDLRTLGRSEHRRHHDFNAQILYQAALSLVSRGSYVRLGIEPQLRNELALLPVPPGLQGSAPFHWQLGQSTFDVVALGLIGIDGKLNLQIRQEVAPWVDDSTPDRQNRQLIAAFKTAYPEYSAVFSAILVQAVERGGPRGFATVDETQALPR